MFVGIKATRGTNLKTDRRYRIKQGVNIMRTIRTKVYKFDELSEQAKQVAIEEVRNEYYDYNDFSEWAIDNCGLLEPPHKELEDLFGQTYDFPLIKNNRKVFFSSGRNRYIDISKAMEITNHSQFLLWLGIKEDDFLCEDDYFIVDYKIGEDTIEFDTTDWSIEFTKKQEEILENAVVKFEEHCEDILKRIEADIDYRFTDEAIIEDIEANDYEFLNNGKQFKQ